MQTYIFYKAIDVGKIVFRAANIETGKWLDAPEFRRLERLLVFLRKNAEKIAPLKDSGIVFNDDGIPPHPKKHVGWKKPQDAYRLLVKPVVDNLDF